MQQHTHRLPLGNTGKGGHRDDRTPSKESSPRADMKKGSSFVEVGHVVSCAQEIFLHRDNMPNDSSFLSYG